MKKKLMAIGAHADDIEIRIGGTLLKYMEKGYKIVYVMSTNNFSGCWQKRKPDGSINAEKPVPEILMKQRKLEAEKGASALGAKPIHLDHPQRHYNLPDGSQTELRYGCSLAPMVQENIPSILTASEDSMSVKRLSELIVEHSPECILTHGPVQINPEHSATSRLVTLAWNKIQREGFACGLLYWGEEHPVFGKSYYKWDSFIDISEYLDRKMELMAIHETQLPRALEEKFPHRTWAKIRGKACGSHACETFTINRLEKGFEFSREIFANLKEYSSDEYPVWDNDCNLKLVRFNQIMG